MKVSKYKRTEIWKKNVINRSKISNTYETSQNHDRLITNIQQIRELFEKILFIRLFFGNYLALEEPPRITLTLTYVVKVTVLSNIQKVLAGAHCLFKSY